MLHPRTNVVDYVHTINAKYHLNGPGGAPGLLITRARLYMRMQIHEPNLKVQQYVRIHHTPLLTLRYLEGKQRPGEERPHGFPGIFSLKEEEQNAVLKTTSVGPPGQAYEKRIRMGMQCWGPVCPPRHPLLFSPLLSSPVGLFFTLDLDLDLDLDSLPTR